jgi:1-acyl-sn-glycerol-3-phosphate acyltransferase
MIGHRGYTLPRPLRTGIAWRTSPAYRHMIGAGPMKQRIASWLLRLLGWRAVGQAPDFPKYVVAAAPHTSNWDFVYALIMFYYFKLDINWLGKESLFRWPFGIFFRWVGGIPIDRTSRNNFVEQAVQAFNTRERMILLLTPEGTRKKTDSWKSGFYYIALRAKVPIVLGFLDYKHKLAGIGPTLIPSGDIEADMDIIREFFTPLTGKYPEKTGTIRIREAEQERVNTPLPSGDREAGPE